MMEIGFRFSACVSYASGMWGSYGPYMTRVQFRSTANGLAVLGGVTTFSHCLFTPFFSENVTMLGFNQRPILLI